MLRIWQAGQGTSSVAVRLEGRIGGLWVSELERFCEALFAEGKRITLDLSDVSFIDARGVDLIRQFSSRGAKVTNASPFVATQLHEHQERTDGGILGPEATKQKEWTHEPEPGKSERSRE